uniref:Uncharacterized protein n=1 Tax=Tanacetum cinerariifolium TaxID=118510 RepID=A0A6L2LT17_TANCI|nr:hypothetical protein [Tanacetum cinerariifolium]
MVFKLKEPLPETQLHAIRDHYFTGAGFTVTRDVLELVMKIIGDDPTQADMLRYMPETMETMTYTQFKEMLNKEFNGAKHSLCTLSIVHVVDLRNVALMAHFALRQLASLLGSCKTLSRLPQSGLRLTRSCHNRIASHVTTIANGRATLSRDYIRNLKDHKQYTWKVAVADSKWPSEVFSLACQLFGVQWTNRGESSHSLRRKPQSKGQAIRMLNVFLPGNSKLLPIEPSKVRMFENLQSLVQDEFAIKAGSYTMRYNKSRSTTGWRPLTDACHLRTLRTLINGEWYV